MRGLQAGVPPDRDTDDAVVEFFEDVADALSDAVNAVVDAIGAAGAAFVNAISRHRQLGRRGDRRTWRARWSTPSRRSASCSSRSCRPATRWSARSSRAWRQIGKAMREILEAAFELARDSLILVLRAIDSLGRQLGELLAFIASQDAEHRAEGGRRDARDRQVDREHPRAGARVRSHARHERRGGDARPRQGRRRDPADGVTRPDQLLRQIVRSFTELGRSLQTHPRQRRLGRRRLHPASGPGGRRDRRVDRGLHGLRRRRSSGRRQRRGRAA